MSLKVQDLGELAYGGLVTGLQRWDERQARTFWKSYSTYGYLVPGVIATGATAMGWMRRYDPWMERLAHGFIYGFPGFIMSIVDAYGGGGSMEKNAAVREAERIARASGNPRRPIGQTAKPGFEGLRTY